MTKPIDSLIRIADYGRADAMPAEPLEYLQIQRIAVLRLIDDHLDEPARESAAQGPARVLVADSLCRLHPQIIDAEVASAIEPVPSAPRRTLVRRAMFLDM